ncbi:hypothetical protein POTOM_030493 [Populus tomentosa]|uniref:Uncharacterized protein n=1 Tax=Populus tomentosa TaxID=118781 RepID=A0A8X7ZBX3_POPTO|nr:hypothetical protein POTOM_030493 [Populus tomentosa]
MAITKTLSLGFSLFFRPTTKHLLHPTVLSHAPKLSLPHQSFYFRCLAPPYKTPQNPFIICHGKVRVSLVILISSSFNNYYIINIFILLSWIVTFLQSMFKKLSKRAKKASRSMLPAVISPQLVSFAVDGILLLAALSIVKALLEVVCTLGSTVFVVILLLRVVWTAVSYFQSSENTSRKGGSSFGTTQPVA